MWPRFSSNFSSCSGTNPNRDTPPSPLPQSDDPKKKKCRCFLTVSPRTAPYSKDRATSLDARTTSTRENTDKKNSLDCRGGGDRERDRERKRETERRRGGRIGPLTAGMCRGRRRVEIRDSDGLPGLEVNTKETKRKEAGRGSEDQNRCPVLLCCTPSLCTRHV